MSRYERLTDEQWTILSLLIPPSPVRADGRRRLEVYDDRAVMDGVLWVLRAGASWADLPDRFPSPSTCFRRFSRWVKAGVLRKILEALARDLEERGRIDLTECFIDGTFTVAKKGAPKPERASGAKGTKLMVIADATDLPLAVHTASASPHEITLVEATLAETIIVGRPQRIVGDRAYDSDPLDQQLAAQGIELIAPRRKNRVYLATQDGRPLRRYRRRWKIERLFAWMNKYKRTLIRWDRCHERFTAFVHLAFSMILMRRLLRFMK